MKFGDFICITNKLVRKRGARILYSRHEKVWVKKDLRPEAGLFLGWRTISDGEISLGDSEDPTTYTPKKHFKAALVCVEGKNPFYSLLD